MSTTVDNRVLEMRFDNKQFESGVATSMSTLEKLKQKLNLSGASKGLENVGKAAKNVNFSGMTGGINAVTAKFSALQVAGVTALANITNQAVNAGKRMVEALTIDPIKTGFQEYETQIGAIQTILANTQNEGTNVEIVNRALDELNAYADKTIYNFTEMTRNIGTFTAAGVKLDTSVNAIKGIANLAAISGSTSQQASSAMYQLSQALAAGKVSLMDWNSVVNAGMGGKVFQDALIRTSELLKTGAKESIETYGSFRESLTQGQWLTTEVLTETLNQFSGVYDKAELMSQGFSEQQANDILKMAQTAEDAATKVKTFTQLVDTVKESVQSGWGQTWRILVGDFEESKELFTSISDELNNIIGKSAESRNKLLSNSLDNNWEKMANQLKRYGIETDTFENDLTKVLENHKINVEELIEEHGSLEKAFRSGALSGDFLKESVSRLTEGMGDLSKIQETLQKGSSGDGVKQTQNALKMLGYDLGESGADGKFGNATEEAVKAFQEANNLKITGIVDESTLSALKEATSYTNELKESINGLIDGITELGGREKIIDSFKNVWESLKDITKPVKDAFREVFPPTTAEQITGIIDKIHNFTKGLSISGDTASKIKSTFKGVFSIFGIGVDAAKALGGGLGTLLGKMSGLGGGFLDVTASIGDWITKLRESIRTSETFGDIVGVIVDIVSGAIDGIKSFGSSIKETLSLDDASGFVDVFSSIFSKIKEVIVSIGEAIGKVFSWISENISAGDIFAGLAGGGIFLAAKKIGGLMDKIKGIFTGFFDKRLGIATKFGEIMDSVHETLSAFTSGIKIASFIGIAAAIALLSSSLRKISDIDSEKLGSSLGSIGLMFVMLTASFGSITKALSKSGGTGLVKAGAALISMGVAIKNFAEALQIIASIKTDDLAKGLIGLGIGLLELSGAIKLINGAKISLRTSVAIIAIAEAAKILADAMCKFSGLSWDEIGRGLTAMGGALLELSGALSLISHFGGGGALLGGVGILVAVQSLDEISDSLKRLGEMSWDEIGKGLSAMGGALGELTIALGALSKIGGFGSILGGTGILIAVQSLDEISENLKRLGEMSWGEIGKGLSAMGGALGEVGLVSGVLGKLSGISGLLGSGSILITIQGLKKLADSLQEFSTMSWGEIGKGLSAMGGALGEVGLVSGVLGKLSGISGLFGSGTILIAVQGLSDLANSFKQFGEMSWNEIGKGLVGMGGALTEVGTVTGALGYLTNFAGLLGSGSLLLAVQGLGDLANAFKKFGEMSWDEIGRGLTAMGAAMAETGIGGLLNTLSGFGAASISEMAEPLGTLADSISKWSSVTVPEGLGEQLGELGKGVKAFTFGGSGSESIATIAEPMGILADSIVKWSSVTVPEGLGDQLKELSTGIKAFTFGGSGSESIATIAEPIGVLADSISKWSSVTVPEGLGDQLKELASGVKSFTLGGFGADTISKAAEPLGAMADSISKWASVTVPENLGSQLQSLATGVKAFTLGGFGADGLTDAITPIGNLATAIAKWNEVTVPENLGSQLQSLATGVKAFGFGDGFVLDGVTEPLKELAGSVKAWNEVAVPEGLGGKLESLATGVKAFGFGDGFVLDGVTEPLKSLAGSIKAWNEVIIPEGLGGKIQSLATGAKSFSGLTVPENIGTSLSNLATGLKSFSGLVINSENLYSAATALNAIKTSVSGLSSINFSSISSGLSGIVSSINNASISTDSFSGLGNKIVDGVVNSINNGQSRIQSAISDFGNVVVSSFASSVNTAASTTSTIGSSLIESLTSGFTSGSNGLASAASSIVSSLLNAIGGKAGEFSSAGTNLMKNFVMGILSQANPAQGAANTVATAAAASTGGYYGTFYSMGSYVASGFVAGIQANIWAAASAAASMAAAASAAARANLAIKSPSRVFMKIGSYVPQGFAKGIKMYGGMVRSATGKMTDSAVNGTQKAVLRISDAFTNDIDTQPTIRPVLDLSDVKSGASAISGMLNGRQSISVMTKLGSISSSMENRSQNGNMDEVVSAINKLRKDLGNVGGTSYNINGVTYDDGSNITSAVETLIRAAKIERRS